MGTYGEISTKMLPREAGKITEVLFVQSLCPSGKSGDFANGNKLFQVLRNVQQAKKGLQFLLSFILFLNGLAVIHCSLL